MFRRFRIGRLFGIPLQLDVTFLLVLPVFAWLIGTQIEAVVPVLNRTLGLDIAVEALTGGLRPILVGFAAALGLFAGVVLHELGHSLVAMWYGYDIKSITLWLLGGVAEPAETPTTWTHEFWIAVAGPIVSVGLGALCYAGLAVVPADVHVGVFLLAYLAVLNVALAAFNMLPAFPLDGGRVLRALLARKRSYVRATRQAAAIGKGFAVVLGIVGLLLLNFFWILIAFFVYIGATAESKQMMLDATFEGITVDELMTPSEDLDTVPPELPLEELLDHIIQERHTGFPVLDDGEFVGLVTLEDVQNAEDGATVVADVMTPADDLETVLTSTDVVDAFDELAANDVGRLPVVDDTGRLIGLVTRTDLMTAFRAITQRQRIEEAMSVAGRS